LREQDLISLECKYLLNISRISRIILHSLTHMECFSGDVSLASSMVHVRRLPIDARLKIDKTEYDALIALVNGTRLAVRPATLFPCLFLLLDCVQQSIRAFVVGQIRASAFLTWSFTYAFSKNPWQKPEKSGPAGI
jgi:hypothetical protein